MSITWRDSGKVEFAGAVLAYPIYHSCAFSRDWEPCPCEGMERFA